MTMTAEQTGLATQNGAGQQVAKRRYDPLAPVGDSGSLKGLMESQRSSLTAMLPKHITPERLFKTMLVAANRNQDLFACTQMSILETINRAAELGLDLSGTLGEAYPVPFNNRVKTQQGEIWVKQCQLIIGYRGYAKLARQTGEIKRIEADVVCKNDKFVLRKGSNATCEFEPCLGERGEPIGAFAFVQFKDDGEQFDFMPVEDIEKVRRRSKSGNNKEGQAIGAWKTDWSEMAKKTVFRRVAKWLPLSTEKFVQAMEIENDDFLETIEASNTPTPKGSRTEETLRRVTSQNANQPTTDETTGRDDDAKDDQVLGATNISAVETSANNNADEGGGKELEDKPNDRNGDNSPRNTDDRPGAEQQAQGEHGTTCIRPKKIETEAAFMSALGEAAMDLAVPPSKQEAFIKLNLPAAKARANWKHEQYIAAWEKFAKQFGGNPVDGAAQ